MLGAIAVRKNMAIGALLLVTLTAISIMTGFGIYMAAGMTAVDGYRC
jgi:hypothetical protein